MEDPGPGIGLLLMVACFLPAAVAAIRRHNNFGAIFLLDLFLGWTVLGWITALVWSATDNTFRKCSRA